MKLVWSGDKLPRLDCGAQVGANCSQPTGYGTKLTLYQLLCILGMVTALTSEFEQGVLCPLPQLYR